jgi:hypothetical protein
MAFPLISAQGITLRRAEQQGADLPARPAMRRNATGRPSGLSAAARADSVAPL